MASDIDLKSEVSRRVDSLVALRRDIHAHPELAFKEERTAALVAERLRTLGLKVKTGVAGTGVVGLLEGSATGNTVIVRADMDALPITEQNQVDYRSRNEGAMHA